MNVTKNDKMISIDPGVTTGIAIKNGEGVSTLVTHSGWELWELIRNNMPNVVIFEDFSTTGHISKDGLYTVRLIGGIECCTNVLNIPIMVQYPPERRPFVQVARRVLQASGKKYLIHEVDALAHLLLYQHREEHGTQPIRRRTNIGRMKV